MLRVLGPVTAETTDGPVTLGGPKERAVLAVLAVSRNHVVSVDALTEALWGDEPPRTATRTLHTYVARLRKNLEGTGVTIDSVPPGYLLRTAVEDVDADHAGAAAGRARARAATEPAAAAGALAEVLDLWRGPALAEFAGQPFAVAEAVRLDELRAAIEEDWVDALLAAGRLPVAEAERLVATNPLRERRWSLLMRALHRDGRQADALRAFQRARDTFIDELGLEPSSALRALEAAILAQDPSLDVPPDVAAASSNGEASGGGVEATTFLLTDIEGSTREWERDAEAMAALLADHDDRVSEVVSAHGGRLIKTKGEGDATFSVFDDPAAAVAAAVELQAHLPVPVRMAIHFGEAEHRAGDWFGTTVNRAGRLRSVAHGRQVVLSGAAAEMARDHLTDGVHLRDLGTHRLKDLDTAERIWQACAPGLPSEFPPLRSLSAGLTNLPAELSSFVGRQAELDQVVALTSESRLVTLTGPGGSGKTRLSMQAGARLLGTFTDGVWLVELAPVGPDQLPGAMAHALRVEAPADVDALDAVIAAVGELELLVIFDNCEHLVEAAAAAAERLLVACPRVRILATSRERLGITGEATWPVLPLGLPHSDDDRTAEAVQLFVQRAQAAKPSFELTDDHLPTIATICRRLDGIPLAIELAAARVRLLTPADIAQRLDDRFGLLTGGARTARPRQQTLRALVDWSYDLLDDDERRLFCELSVFRGGFTLAAAGAVHRAGGGVADVLDLVDRLAEKSLIVSGDGERFGMLETLREYGLERLEAHDAATIGAAHAAWVEQMVAEGALENGPGQATAVALMRAEQDNILAALGWCLAHDATPMAASIIAGCWRIWYVIGFIYDGSQWASRVLEAAADAPLDPVARGEVLIGAGWLGHLAGTRTDTAALLEEAVRLVASEQPTAVEAMACALFAEVTRQQDMSADVAPLLERAIELADSCGARQEAGIARSLLSFTMPTPDHTVGVLREALADAEAAGDRWLQGLVAMLLAWTAGDSSEGDRLRAIAMAAARDLNDHRGLAATLIQEAVVRVARGDAAHSREAVLEALAIVRSSGEITTRSDQIWSCGTVLEAIGDLDEASALIEESDSLLSTAKAAQHLDGTSLIRAYIATGRGDLTVALGYLRTSLAHSGPSRFPLGMGLRLTARLAAEADDRGVAAALLAGLDAATDRGEWSVLPDDLHDADDRRRITERLGAAASVTAPPPLDLEATVELARRWVSSRLEVVSEPEAAQPVAVDA